MAQPSTQNFLEFEQIKDGTLVLKNKSLRIILAASSINFALKSEEEQNAIIFQFQDFLNSLDFPCQISVQSRRLNMTGYLDKLEEIEINEKNDLLKLQVSEYRNFVDGILKEGFIMQKSFYVVVPFFLSETTGIIPSAKSKTAKFSGFTEEEFSRCKNQLLQRAEYVAMGLRRCGVESVPLNTPELVELFWSIHHPIEAERGYYPEIPLDLTQ